MRWQLELMCDIFTPEFDKRANIHADEEHVCASVKHDKSLCSGGEHAFMLYIRQEILQSIIYGDGHVHIL